MLRLSVLQVCMSVCMYTNTYIYTSNRTKITDLVVVHEGVGLPIVLDIWVALLRGQFLLILRLQYILRVLGRNVRPAQHLCQKEQKNKRRAQRRKGLGLARNTRHRHTQRANDRERGKRVKFRWWRKNLPPRTPEGGRPARPTARRSP